MPLLHGVRASSTLAVLQVVAPRNPLGRLQPSAVRALAVLAALGAVGLEHCLVHVRTAAITRDCLQISGESQSMLAPNPRLHPHPNPSPYPHASPTPRPDPSSNPSPNPVLSPSPSPHPYPYPSPSLNQNPTPSPHPLLLWAYLLGESALELGMHVTTATVTTACARALEAQRATLWLCRYVVGSR